jgi:hypothetical protein
MIKSTIFAAVLAATAATPALAGSYVDQYPGYWGPEWAPYPDYAAFIPYGLPMVPATPTTTYVPEVSDAPLPARLYYIPQQAPLYNVPPYVVLAPY